MIVSKSQFIVLLVFSTILWVFTSCENNLNAPIAKELGPFVGGRFTGIAPDHEDPNKLAISSPGGGVWVTVDNGANWTSIFKGLNDPSVHSIEWDIVDKKRLYAITPSTLFACDNPFGESPEWIELAGGTNKNQIPIIDFYLGYENYSAFKQLDFGNQKRAIIWARQGTGIYYSFDGKKFEHHTPITTDISKEEAFITTIGADENNVVYFATTNKINASPPPIYKSSDIWKYKSPSLKWKKVNRGMGIDLKAIDFEWLSDVKKLALLTQGQHRNITGSHVFLFNQNTNTWETTKTSIQSASWATSCITDLGDSSFILGTVFKYQTDNLGRTWEEKGKGDEHADTRIIIKQYYPKLSKTFVWSATDGFNGTQDLGSIGNLMRWELNNKKEEKNFQYISVTGAGALQAHCGVMVYTSKGKRRYLVGSLDNGNLLLDENNQWERGFNNSGCGDTWSAVVAPSDSNRVYLRYCSRVFTVIDNFKSASTSKQIKYQYLNKDESLNLSAPHILSNGMTAVHPKNKDKVYLATSSTIAISNDGGKKFKFSKLPNDAQPICTYVTEKELYAGSAKKGIFISYNDGKSWKEFGLKNTLNIYNITKSKYKGGTLYAATSDGLYRKYPNEDWKLTTVKGTVVSDVVVRPGRENFVWISLGYTGVESQKGGILISNNYGDSWRTLYEEGVPISDLSLTMGTTPKLIVSTYGRGLKSIDLSK